MNLIEFPDRNIQDIPAALRRLADAIEANEFGDVYNVAWVMNASGFLSIGLLGASTSLHADTLLLLMRGQKELLE